jgi:trehalose 2-sulfotransferase
MTVASYIICATPRSGSTLLCDLLSQTGVAGHPNSFYRQESLADFVKEWSLAPGSGIDFERRFLAAAIKAGTGDTGTFGMRVMWPSMPYLLEQLGRLFPDKTTDTARLSAAFGAPLYIHLQRKDRVAQAISRAKAEQSGLWHRHADGSARELVKEFQAPVYDRIQLERCIAEAEEHEAHWHRWFDTIGITPLELTYEDLSADPTATLARTLGALGKDPDIAARVTVQTARLADAQSRDWAERFRDEG